LSISKLLLKNVITRKINEIGRYAVKNEFVKQFVSTVYRSSFLKKITNRLDEMMDRKLLNEVKQRKLPRHIAIIMDGNRRFADKLGLEHIEGHLLGRDRFEEVIDWCFSEIGIKVLTFYAFSIENFRRDGKEVNDIMRLCIEELEQGANSFRIHDNKIRVRIIGHLESLPKDVHDAAKRIMDQTKNYNKRFLNVALAYGGREDILQAIHRIAGDVKDTLKSQTFGNRYFQEVNDLFGLPRNLP